MSRAVVVMGKVPRPGRVKTRLTRSLSPEVAAGLYQAFLLDTFRLVDRAVGAACRRVFAVALGDGDDVDDARALVPEGWAVAIQQGASLGDRIDHARALGRAEQVLVMGSDSPTLPEGRLREAFEALAAGEDRTAAVVPTTDGGYALIGFGGAAPELLTDVPWSTEAVMAVTRRRAADAGVRLVELAMTYDVDHPEDLDRLRADADPVRHPATVSALASLR